MVSCFSEVIMFDIKQYVEIVDRLHRKLESYTDICHITSPEEDWSITELLSHLIDSASNNHQRFIRLQYENILQFPGYDAEIWRRISKTKNIDYARLIALWKSYNWYIIELIQNIDHSMLNNYWQCNDKQLTLEFLVQDYFRHLLWHEKLFDEIEQRARKKA